MEVPSQRLCARARPPRQAASHAGGWSACSARPCAPRCPRCRPAQARRPVLPSSEAAKPAKLAEQSAVVSRNYASVNWSWRPRTVAQTDAQTVATTQPAATFTTLQLRYRLFHRQLEHLLTRSNRQSRTSRAAACLAGTGADGGRCLAPRPGAGPAIKAGWKSAH